jgi:hypothetical protein
VAEVRNETCLGQLRLRIVARGKYLYPQNSPRFKQMHELISYADAQTTHEIETGVLKAFKVQ